MLLERRALAHSGTIIGLVLGLLGVAACQAIPPGGLAASQAASNQPPSPAGSAGLAEVPDCAAGIVATLSGGVQIGYHGSDPDDPDRCLLNWSGRSHPLYFGLWSTGPDLPMSEEARAAFRTALTGPVGTEASFEMQRARLWKRVTVTHVANTTIDVAGQPRSALELRVVRHDAAGRPDVRAETRYAIDRATGVLLRSQSVTPMADGAVTTTTSWQIEQIDKPTHAG
jgi:hypothetical protein